MARPWEVRAGEALERLAEMPDSSVDAVVTDPPYGLEFMGKDWDRLGDVRQPGDETFTDVDNPYGRSKVRMGGSAAYRAPETAARMQAWHEAWAREALRVLKPGGHLLAFGGTRTFHRLGCAIEDAGFEVRDCLMWLYGSGFPKSLDVSKAIDRAAGAEREVVGTRAEHDITRPSGGGDERLMTSSGNREVRQVLETAPATAEAQEWDGWGTALKPGWEPIVVARKPLAGTVAGNVLEHGTGAINVKGCQVGFAGAADEQEAKAKNRHADFGSGPRANAVYGEELRARGEIGNYDPAGRWPANVVLSHDEDCVLVGSHRVRANGHFPAARGPSGYGSAVEESSGGGLKGQDELDERRFDGEVVETWACVPGCPVRMLDAQSGQTFSGGTSGAGAYSTGVTYGEGAGQARGRQVGLGDRGGASRFYYCAKASRAERSAGLEDDNDHPTVKPIDLMRWLVRLVTPAAGLVVDPFVGSGTTGCAAVLEGFEFVGVDRDAGYVELARARVRFWAEHPTGLPVELALRSESRRREVRESGQLGIEF